MGSLTESMAVVETDWRQFLALDSELPPDVTFNIIERVTFTATGIQEEQKTSQTVAHKFLLAGCSPVFRNQFFGALKETGDIVEIKETTAEAFNFMIRYIYKTPGSKISLKHITSPVCLYEVLNLAEKYELPSLKDIAEDALEAFPVTPENLIALADAATVYHMFEDISNMVTEKCYGFLQHNLRITTDASSKLLTSHTSNPTLLPELLKGIETCPKCNRIGAECLDGQDVTGQEDPPLLKPGVIIRNKGWHDKSDEDCDCFGMGKENVFTIEKLLIGAKQGNVK